MPSKTPDFPEIPTGHQRRTALRILYFGLISHAPVVILTFIHFVKGCTDGDILLESKGISKMLLISFKLMHS